MATFDRNKYKDLFEKRYGSGSYEQGLSSAREIGRLQAEAKFAQESYKQRQKEAEKAAKEAAKKTTLDAKNDWDTGSSGLSIKDTDDPEKMAEEIRNDPWRQEQIKKNGYSVKQYIDGMYNSWSKGRYRSEREYNEANKARAKRNKEAEDEGYLDYSDKVNTERRQTKAEQPSKKNDTSILDRLKNLLPAGDSTKTASVGRDAKEIGKDLLETIIFKQNPSAVAQRTARDYVSKGNTLSKPVQEVARGAVRTANTATLGTLEELAKRNREKPHQDLFFNNRSGAGAVGDFAYDALGYLFPGVGAANALRGTRFGANMATTGARKVGQLAKEGAVTGGLLGGLEVGIREGINPDDYSARQNLAHLGLGVGLGAVGDPLLYGAGRAVGRGINSLRNRGNVPTPTPQAPQTSQPLGLPEPQLQLPEPQLQLPSPRGVEPTFENFQRAFTPPTMRNPIPQMPDELRGMMRQERLNQDPFFNFGQRGQTVPEPRYRMAEPQQTRYRSVDSRQDQSYWQSRYEDFSRHVNSNYDMNRMTPEALEDLWTQFARYDEPYTLTEVIDLAYPKGFEASTASTRAQEPPVPEEPRQEPLLDALRADPRVEEQIKQLFPPTVARPESRVSRPATIEETADWIRQDLPLEPTPPILEPLQFRRSAGDMDRQVGNRPNSGEQSSILDTLPRVNQAGASNQGDILDSLPRIGQEPMRAGRDFEPIEQAPRGNEPPLARVADELLDPQRQASGNAESFRGKVDRSPQKKDSILAGLRTQFIDDLAPLESLEKRITGGVASAEDSLYKQGRLFRGSPEKAHQMVQEELGPILNKLTKSKYKPEDLGDYALAVHARDVNAKGINSGFSNAEIEDTIKKYGTPEMESLRKELLRVNNKMLDYLSTGEAPVLSREAVEAMREKYPNYMSLARHFDDDKVEFAAGMGNALSVGSSPIHKLKGSSRDVIDPLESMVKNIMQAVNTADRNKVASQLGKLADHEKAKGIVNRLPKGAEVGRKNVISMMDKGEKVNFEVPPEVYKAMKDLDKETTKTLVKIFQKPAGWLRAGATLTPEFSLRNPMRDVPQAFIVSESGFNPVTDFTVGLWDTIWKGREVKIGNKTFKPSSGELYKQFIKENGGYGNIVSMDRDLHKDVLQRTLTDGDPNYINVLNGDAFKKLVDSLKHPLRTTKGVLQGIADVSETGTKLGEFRAARRQGASPQEAAYRARDIMDYARAGVSIRDYNKIVAFLNANVQGKSKLWRAFQKNPMKFIGKSTAAITLPTIGAIFAQETMSNDKQKEILDDAPQWMRDSFYLIPVPGTDQVARIPKPFDLAYPFSNTLERGFQFVKNNDEEAYDNFMRSAISAAAVPVMITGLVPILEGMGNYSGFRQGPIIPQREQNLEYPDQYDINTSEVAKLIGRGVNEVTEGEGMFRNFGSPRIIDNTIQGLFGGLGTYAVSGIDSVIDLFADEEKPERPAKSIDQKPLAKAFLVNQSAGGQSMDDLYSEKDKLTRQRGSAKQNNEKFDKERQYKFLNNATKRLSEINKRVREIQNSGNFTAEQKKQMMDPLIEERNRIARETMDRYQTIK